MNEYTRKRLEDELRAHVAGVCASESDRRHEADSNVQTKAAGLPVAPLQMLGIVVHNDAKPIHS
ncbi:hypothetical protein [Cupriavidus pampae]|uniref:Uncharacterized protein n=1 Tax=Cupriavidus pampae TaxID=659251 RepID=A0ABN7ZGT2_9BURK|nr:hypothetical protein [Cupriavidus pampae]CAG9183891.1 hypothetical protein LMG32289_05455 [Cupriavidus pampae]